MSSTATKPNPTPAQEEFNDLIAKNAGGDSPRIHPEDRDEARLDAENSEEEEEDQYRNQQIDEVMRTPALGRGPSDGGDIKLPPAAFDSGRSTGVKGVIADARSYEQARQSKWRNRIHAARRSVFGIGNVAKSNGTQSGESEEEMDPDEEAFLQQWREARRAELESEAAKNQVRSRRTSPSLRLWGRLDDVEDAMGYLDAIEKVGRDTTVVVFVYDNTSDVSGLVESTLRPLVYSYPQIHFVKVHYEEIEFDRAAVPTVLGYRNQGELFANLTSIIDLIPEDDEFDIDSMKKLFQKNGIL